MNPYAAIARYRRRYYATRPDLQRRLGSPVISVGNVAVGGRGKTPLVAHIAALLRDAGERPAILTRGYARARAEAGIVVVRDPSGIRADVDRAGDEPMMLARQLGGVAVLTSPNRYVAGRLAEHHFGCTVHVLDDGFQHFALHRDADIVLVSEPDVDDARTLPFGRLREPFDALASADAIVALDFTWGSVPSPGSVARGDSTPRSGHSWGALCAPPRSEAAVFRAAARMERPVLAWPAGAGALEPNGACVALAGIATPERFFSGLRAMGWPIAREVTYPDHHRYSRRDVAHILRTAAAQGADVIVTTEKDLVRLLPFRPLGVRLAVVPLRMSVAPEAEFRAWLLARVEAARREAAA